MVAALRAGLAERGWSARVVGPAEGDRASLDGQPAALVHVDGAGAARTWVASARAAGARAVVTVHGDEATAASLAAHPREPVAWVAADALHADDAAVAALLRRETGAELTVIEPAADPDLLALEPGPRPRAAEAPLRLLTVAPVSWTAGLEFALAGAVLLVDRGVACEYRIVGRGPHRDAVAFARHELGLEASVELVEPEPERVRDALRWADVLVDAAVLPSAPGTILDAQAAGLPVVTTRPPEAAGDGAIAVPPRDARALSEALALLAAEPERARALAAAGRERAARAPSAEQRAARFAELYERVVAGARAER